MPGNGHQDFKETKPGFRVKILGWGFLGLGFVFLVASSLILVSRPSPLSFEEKPDLSLAEPQVLPKRVKIDSAKIDLPVYQAKLNEKNWPLFEDGATYLLGSGQIGKKGNSVIYAHNKSHLFGFLGKIKNGDLIEIEDEKGKIWVYQTEEILRVSPKAVGILSPKDYSALTLYTCTGFWGQKRLVVVARLALEP